MKRGTLAEFTNRSRTAILNEIAKCDVVCSNCHRIRTFRLRDHSACIKSALKPSDDTASVQLSFLAALTKA